MTNVQNIAVLEPGYADYATEKTVLVDQNVRIVSVVEQKDAVSSLSEIDPVAVLVRERAITATEMDCCPNLKVIVRYGVGVDNIDVDAAKARGIYVANVPDYGAETEVSEHTVALYLAVQRRIASRDREVREGSWGIGQDAPIPSREDAVLGLIGCGRIGLQVARKFQVFGFTRTLVYDPYLPDDVAREHGVESVELQTLCRAADVISLHAPLSHETHHILAAEQLGLMKPSSIVINVSRGGLVDELALAAALHEGRLFGAGLDVFEQEPLRTDHPLRNTPNTILSDHTAWYSERSVKVLQSNAAKEVYRVLNGEKPKNWVNPW